MPRGNPSVVFLEPLVPDAVPPLLSRVTPCSHAYAIAECGTQAAVHAMLQDGALRELPAHCTPAQFRELFADISLVSRTGVAVQSHGKGAVHLAAPAGGTVKVITALYEVLRRSTTGSVPVPVVIDRVAPKWGGPEPIIAEVIGSLRALLASGAVALVQTVPGDPFVPPGVGQVEEELGVRQRERRG